jgi:hypothetical protein
METGESIVSPNTPPPNTPSLNTPPREPNRDRRLFLGAAGAAAVAAGAAGLGAFGSSKADASVLGKGARAAAAPGTKTSFGPVKQIKAGVRDIIAALWPARVKALVSVSGYLITNLAAQKEPLPPKAENDWWYQYYFDTERGVLGLEKYRYELGDFIWQFNSPTWHYSEAAYAQTAQAFNNPDYVSIVIGNYRWRQSRYPSEPEYAAIEAKLQKAPTIAVPTITIDGKHDPFTPAGNGSAYRDKFTGEYRHLTFDVGHNVPQEAPEKFAEAVVAVNHF